MSLLAYVASALMARPHWGAVLRGTLMPHLHVDRDLLTMIVAIIGASLSADIFTWQSNEEVEEKIAARRHSVRQRRGATPAELRQSFGMLYSGWSSPMW